ncbi:Vitamin B12 import ATP-binding protein BtuD [Methanosarcinaceae archaeon Ag5]|uniref:Vitamin B12 import ATP-binding protein BtuD n=2 Tax=Methanolapillus africanus TaxID=3028297 RepID=A0AAE4SFN9_9EURY|nr:Vitamin B12 import ATP-binding protein BtuD [Methanosarcinaceae archaeon Ag5]
MFEIRNVSFQNTIFYPDISIFPNQVTFISGESGSGKSTLLRFLNGTMTPNSGSVLFFGNDVAVMDPIDLRRQVLLANQSVFLFDGSIRNNFAQFYSFLDKKPPSYDEISRFLRICCLDFPLDKNCSVLSGGERHRVFIAVCLSFLPKVLLMDEPTSDLDERNAVCLIRNVIAFAKEKGITLVIVSHDAEIVKQFSDWTIVIEKSNESCDGAGAHAGSGVDADAVSDASDNGADNDVDNGADNSAEIKSVSDKKEYSGGDF